MIGDAALVGRAEELDFLRAAVTEAGGAVIGGAAGVGKTRLARELAAHLEGWCVEWTAATPATAELPLGGVAGLGLGDNGKSPAGGAAALLNALTAKLVERAEGRRVAVVVDDAHLLDDLSSAFIHRVAVTRTASVLLTVRTGEQPSPTIVQLYKDAVLPRLELQPLAIAEFAELAEAIVGGPIDEATTVALWRSTAGNVLFLRELLADAGDAHAGSVEDGVWRWHRGAAVGPRLAELVADRMGRLEGVRRVLAEVLAVAEPLGPGLLSHVVPDADLAEAERSGLIVVDEDGRRAAVRLAHPLFAEVVRARLGVLARRDVQRRLAEALEAIGAHRRTDVLRLAIWRLDSGTASDARLLTQAAEAARQGFDPTLAVRLARASLDIGPSVAAQITLGGALADLGKFADAAAFLDQVDGTGLDGTAFQALTRDRAWTAFHTPAGLAAAQHTLAVAEAATADPVLQCLARGDLAVALSYHGLFEEALAVSEPLIAPEMDERVRLRSLSGVGAGLAMAGHFDRVLALCDELEPVARRRGRELPRATTWVIGTRANAMILSGRVAESVAMLSPLFAPGAPPLGRPSDHAYAMVKFARALLLAGRPSSALAALDTAASTLRTNDGNGCFVWCLSLMAEAHALLGDPGAGAHLARQAIDRRSAGFAVFDGDAARARAWVVAAAGEHSRAVAELTAAAESQQARGQQAFALFALHDAQRLGAPIGRRVEDLAADIDGPFAAAVALHATGVREGAGEVIEEAADRFASHGMWVLAAETAADAAHAWREAGRTAQAAAMARASESSLGNSELAALPIARHRANAARPAPLTRRELEVASLAAQGLSNGDIAARLVLSVRTVESHLYAACRKTGANRRHELAVVLGEVRHGGRSDSGSS